MGYTFPKGWYIVLVVGQQLYIDYALLIFQVDLMGRRDILT